MAAPLTSRLALYWLVTLSACQKTSATPGVDAAPPLVPDAAAGMVAVVEQIRDAETIHADAQRSALRVDGGAACAHLFGPEEMPFHGPATPLVRGNELLLVTNESGKAHLDRRSIVPPGRDPQPAAPKQFRAVRWPACEVAGDQVYCVASGSILQRSPLFGGPPREITRTKPGTRIAASALGEGHTAVFYLAEHRTTEGLLNEAFVAVDDREPKRVSEEGSGATEVLAAPIGRAALVLMLDARLSMTPVHARTLRVEGDRTTLGKDSVVFVGGSPELGVEMAFAQSKETVFGLVPLPVDVTHFGLAVIPIVLPARDDMPFTWSHYPNGLDPAPVGATQGAERPTVVSLRPTASDAGVKKVLEMGSLGEDGEYVARGSFVPAGKVTEIRVVRDGFGADWILYGDTSRTWLERRLCK